MDERVHIKEEIATHTKLSLTPVFASIVLLKQQSAQKEESLFFLHESVF